MLLFHNAAMPYLVKNIISSSGDRKDSNVADLISPLPLQPMTSPKNFPTKL